MEEVKVLYVSSVSRQTVDKVLQDALRDLRAELVIITEDVLHRLCLLELHKRRDRGKTDNTAEKTGETHQKAV